MDHMYFPNCSTLAANASVIGITAMNRGFAIESRLLPFNLENVRFIRGWRSVLLCA